MNPLKRHVPSARAKRAQDAGHVGNRSRARRRRAARLARSVRLADHGRECTAQRGHIADRDEQARVRGHGVAHGTRGVLTIGKPARERFGKRHPVAFVVRREHRRVGAVVVRGERRPTQLAREPHPIGETEALDLWRQREDGLRAAI